MEQLNSPNVTCNESNFTRLDVSPWVAKNKLPLTSSENLLLVLLVKLKPAREHEAFITQERVSHFIHNIHVTVSLATNLQMMIARAHRTSCGNQSIATKRTINWHALANCHCLQLWTQYQVPSGTNFMSPWLLAKGAVYLRNNFPRELLLSRG